MLQTHPVVLRVKLRVVHHPLVPIHPRVLLGLGVVALLRAVAVRVRVLSVGVVEVSRGVAVHGGGRRTAALLLLPIARCQRVDELVRAHGSRAAHHIPTEEALSEPNTLLRI